MSVMNDNEPEVPEWLAAVLTACVEAYDDVAIGDPVTVCHECHFDRREFVGEEGEEGEDDESPELAPGVSTRTLPDGSAVSWTDFKGEDRVEDWWVCVLRAVVEPPNSKRLQPEHMIEIPLLAVLDLFDGADASVRAYVDTEGHGSHVGFEGTVSGNRLELILDLKARYEPNVESR